ncbi:MAG: SDR family oxidoreductase [Ignavibacteriae bacterium]|nr:SDR family oxidoreductase [Ignavibacteriota bacterium]
MKNILVTGATGCVGSNLIAALLERGYTVRAFHREHSNLLALQGLDVEHRTGDVRDKDSLRRAMEGCDTVFHAAALVSFWKKKYQEQYDVNVIGTRNIINVSLKVGIEKLIHTSSVAALGYRLDGKLIDEMTPYNWGPNIGYRYTKHLAELEVLNGVSKGLHAVILNPSVIIGPRDVYVHGGQIVRDIKRGRIPIYVRGGMNIVSVHDVVTGHLAAVEHGRSGERYILAGMNFTHKEVFDVAAKVVGGRAPRIRIPVRSAQFAARMFDFIGEVTNKQPWVTSDLISGAGKCNWYTAEKAERELGYHPSSVEDAMRETYEWYVEKKMI